MILYVTAAFLAVYFLGRLLLKNSKGPYDELIPFLLTTCEGGNVALPLYTTIVGAGYAINTVTFDMAGVILAFVIVPAIVTARTSGSADMKSMLKKICTNSFVVSSVLGLVMNLTGLSFPYYVGCLFGGALIRNIADARGIELRMYEIDVISSCCLNLFLSMVLMSLNIAKLISLAGPMIVILLSQAVVMMLWAYFVTFNTTGRDYDAAVMAAGHCGVGLGQTPNAVANMAAVIDKNGPAPTAWFVLPVVTFIFINIMNPIIITFFINLLK